MNRLHRRVLLPSLLPLLFTFSPLHASELDPVAARYEQMLLRTPEPGAAFDRLYDSFAKGQGIEALEKRWQVEADKGSAPHWLLLGMLAERRNQPATARKAYAKAAELAVEDYRAWSALGKLEASQGKLQASIAALEKALAAKPPETLRAELYRSLALSQQRDLNHAGALATLQRALKEFPDDVYLLDEIVEAQIEAGSYTDAQATYEKLRELAGSDPFRKVSATIKLAQLQERQRKISEAIAIYESALPMTSETSWMHREVRNRIELVYRRQDDLPGLITYYTKWLEKHPKDVEVARRLSITCRELNRSEEAIKWLSQAAEWAPDRRDLQMELARSLRSAGQIEEALKLTTRLTERFPEELSYHELRGEIEWDRYKKTRDGKHKAEALASWNHLAPATTKDPARITRLAELLRSHQCGEEALAEYQRAIEVSPGSNDLRERLAEYLFLLDREDEAWAMLDTMVEGDRATAANYRRLALVQSRHGRGDAAQESISKGLALEPTDFALLSLQWRLLVEAQKLEEAIALHETMLKAAPAMAAQLDMQQARLFSRLGKERVEKEIAALKAKTSEAEEHELRLLAQLLIQSTQGEEAAEVIAQAQARFPQSALLIRQEVEIHRQAFRMEAAITALRKLVDLEPKQAAKVLQDISRIWAQIGKFDEAIAAAQEALALSPANAEGHRFLADSYRNAGKVEEARTAFREAVRLSDQPTVIQRQFADFELHYGDPAAARVLLDAIFEAEETTEKKQATLQAMVPVYNQLGQLDALIARFRSHQKEEENGWRYALYLAAIYRTMGDATQAREELTKVLASRPTDPALLNQLIGLAEAEGNIEEVTRFLSQLLESDPSAKNRAKLAEAKASLGELDETLELLLTASADIQADPQSWTKVYQMLSGHPRIDEANAVMKQALEATQGDLEGQMQLAEFFILTNQRALAEETLWRLLSDAANESLASALGGGGKDDAPRPPSGIQRIHQARNFTHAYQMLTANRPGRNHHHFSRQNPNTTPLPPQTIHDKALIYLAAMAIDSGTEETLKEKLQQHLTGSNLSERLACLAIVGATDRLEQEIRACIASARRSRGELEMLIELLQFRQLAELDKTVYEEALDLTVAQIKEGNVRQEAKMMYVIHDTFKQLGQQEKGDAMMREWLKTPEARIPATAHQAAHRAADLGEYAIVEELYAIEQQKPRKQGQGHSCYGPIATAYKNTKQTEKLHALLMGVYQEDVLGNPSGGSNQYGSPNFFPTGFNFSSSSRYFHAYFPHPSRYLSQHQLSALHSIANHLKEIPGASDAFAKELTKMKFENEGEALRNQLAQVIFFWSHDNVPMRKKAAGLLREMLKNPQAEDLAIQASIVESELGNAKEAMEMLDKVSTRHPDHKQAQFRLLQLAKENDDSDRAKKALTALVSENLSLQEQRTLIEDLRQYGMTEQVEKLEGRAAQNPAAASIATRNEPHRPSQQMQTLRQQNKKEEAVSIARAVLARTPSLQGNRGGDSHNRRVAIDTLRHFQELAPYLAQLEKEAADQPLTVALGVKLIEAYDNDQREKAIKIARKIAAIRPDDSQFQVQLAEQLNRSGQHDESIDLYLNAFRKDPSLLMHHGNQIIHHLKQKNRLGDLSEIALAASDRNFPSNQGDASWFYRELGRQLLESDKDTAVKIWRKGLEIGTVQMNGNTVQIRQELLQLLADEKKEDELREELLAAFFPPKRTTALSIASSHHGSRYNWFQTNTQSADGRMSMPALDMVKKAVELGLAEEFRKRAESDAQLKKELGQFLRVAEKDRSLLEEMLAELSGNRLNQVNFSLVQATVHDAVDWDGIGDLPLRLLNQLAEHPQFKSNAWSRFSFARQRVLLADRSGDKELRIKAYQAWIKDADQQGRGNVNAAELGQKGQVMIELGLIKEATEALKQGRAVASQHRHGQIPALDELAAQLALAQGEYRDPQAIVGLQSEQEKKNGEEVIFWNIASTSIPNHGNRRSNPRLSGRTNPMLDGKFDIELLHLSPPNAVRRLAVIKKAASVGQWKGKLPAESGAISARLLAKDVAYEGMWVAYEGGENLLQPIVGREGWKFPANLTVTNVADDLHPGSQTLSISASDHSERIISSESVPLKKNTTYSLTGWIGKPQNDSISIRIRILDSNGAEITKNWVPLNMDGSIGWYHFQTEFSTKQQSRNNVQQLPDNAAAVEVLVGMHQAIRLVDFKLVELPEKENATR